MPFICLDLLLGIELTQLSHFYSINQVLRVNITTFLRVNLWNKALIPLLMISGSQTLNMDIKLPLSLILMQEHIRRHKPLNLMLPFSNFQILVHVLYAHRLLFKVDICQPIHVKSPVLPLELDLHGGRVDDHIDILLPLVIDHDLRSPRLSLGHVLLRGGLLHGSAPFEELVRLLGGLLDQILV